MARDNRTISQSMRNKVASYYIDLYENLDMQTMTQIAKELNIHHDTVRTFIDKVSSEGYSINKMFVIVMLCTRFSEESPYFEVQKKFSKFIKRRQIEKELRQKINNKRKEKTL